MKLHFRLKIAILSFAVSGMVLTGFGIAFFIYTYSSGIDRMDREIRGLIESPLRGGLDSQYWQNFGKSLQFIYGGNHPERIGVMVFDRENNLLYQSENAPDDLAQVSRPPMPTTPNRPAPNRPTPPDRDHSGPAEFHKHLMGRLDLDENGRLSRDEFEGPPDHFEQADEDANGFLTSEELEFIGTLGGRHDRHFPPHGRLPGNEPLKPRPQEVKSRFQTLETLDADWRVGAFSSPNVSVVAAMDMDAFYGEVSRLRNAFIISVPLVLLLLGVTGWFLAARAMKPVSIIADTAEGITAKGLDQRIPKVGNDAELERLVTVTNEMFDRLEKSYSQAVQFSSDAAHELQTPLTILQGELDNAIQISKTGSEEQQRYSMLLEELSNLKAVVQKLLLLAHADEGRLKLNLQPVNLSELIEDAAEDMEIMAPELTVGTHIPPGISIHADSALLNQSIRNMASNAAKYAPGNGRADFTLEQDKRLIIFTLANTADPIPSEDIPFLFERFHRVDKARSTTGSGLGLSLAREIARAHGGDLVLNNYNNGMVSFSLKLPLS